MKARLLLPLFLAAAAGQPLFAQGDPAVVEKLLVEGKENNQVWETLTYLSEEIGPRLTGSSGLEESMEWTMSEFERLGLQNVHLDQWGEIPVRFDRGPSHARMVSPAERELEFTARSWSPGTEGPVRARVLKMPKTLDELDAAGNALAGAWVLVENQPRRSRRGETDEEKAVRMELEALEAEIEQALDGVGIAGKLVSSSNELVITSSVRGWRELTMDTIGDEVEVRIRKSDYEALAAAIDAGEEVVVEVNLDHRFSEGPFLAANVVADIPGTELPDEMVIFSGHLDTWDGPGSMGTQDNGTGCAVMLEAARILMTAGVKPKRTIRFILWTGEEQGLFGSRSYVERLSEEERAKISAVFVDDGGTNYQGGVMCIESMAEMLDRAMAPVMAAFPELEMKNVVRPSMPRGGGSDHSPFNQAGIPGFFFNESGSGGREGKNYTFVHHTQHDTMRYAVPEYLVQSSTNSAVVAYQMAEAETLLPREIPGEVAEVKLRDDPTFVVKQGEVSGDWDVSFTGSEAPDMGFTISLEMAEDNRIRGHLIGQLGKSLIQEGKWDPEKRQANFSAMTDFGDLGFTATIEAGAMVGTLSAMGNDLEFTGKPKALADAPINGKWNGLITTMDSEFTLVLQVAADGALTGRFKSSQSDSELYDTKWDPEKQTLSFEYDYPHAGRLPVTARLVDGKLVGVIGENAEFEATLAATE